jgi:hypothetical protein
VVNMGGGQVFGAAFGAVFFVVYIGVGIWVLWKFYRALARIGEELAEIKTALRPLLPGTEPPPPR